LISKQVVESDYVAGRHHKKKKNSSTFDNSRDADTQPGFGGVNGGANVDPVRPPNISFHCMNE
jgi:hypothetical protein